MKTKITNIVSTINEIGYIILIIVSCLLPGDTNFTFVSCILMMLRSALGIWMICIWKSILYATSPDFIDTIKPFYLTIAWKTEDFDPDLLPKNTNSKKQATKTTKGTKISIRKIKKII